MLPTWRKVRTVLAGTDAMRKAGQAMLPRHEGESHDAYMERLHSTVLLNVSHRTLDKLAGRPFSDPIRLSDKMHEAIKGLMDDIDLEGNNVSVFAREWFRRGLSSAFCHVMIEFPVVERPADRPRTLDDDRREGLRPYWVLLEPEDVFAMRSERINGEEVVTHVRIMERKLQTEGFEEYVVEQIREINLVENDDGSLVPLVQIWVHEKPRDYESAWMKAGPPMPLQGIDRIPIVTFYADRQGLLFGKPPIEDLVDKNIEHWQSSSDQRAILKTARFPMLALSGGTDPNGKLTVGPNSWLHSPDTSSKFYYVEHSGRAINSGKQDLDSLESQMAQFGAEFMRVRPDRETATAASIDEKEATSPLQDLVLRFSDAVRQALVWTARWMRLEEDDAGFIEITGNLVDNSGSPQDLQTLAHARDKGDIDQRTFLLELRRRAVLSNDIDIDAIQEAVKSEDEERLQREVDRVLLMAAASGDDTDPDEGSDE